MSRAAAFIEAYPNAEIRGGMIVAIQQALGAAAAPYFARAGFVDVSPNGWYSLTNYLQVLYEIFEHEPNVMQNMVSLGMSTAEHAILPPEIDTLEKGLKALEMGWSMNTRSAKPAIWSVQPIDDHNFICVNTSPFPIDQEYGVVYGFARRFAGGRRCTVAYENLADRDYPDKEEVRFLVKVG